MALFSHSLNCTSGTKSRKASMMTIWCSEFFFKMFNTFGWHNNINNNTNCKMVSRNFPCKQIRAQNRYQKNWKNVWNMFEVNNKDTRTTPMMPFRCLLLTLNIFYTLLWCVHCSLWTSKCLLGGSFSKNMRRISYRSSWTHFEALQKFVNFYEFFFR